MSRVSSGGGYGTVGAPTNRNSIDATAAAATAGGVDLICISRGGAQSRNLSGNRAVLTEADLSPANASPADYTRMTPSEMSRVAQGLYDGGKIDIIELFVLQNAGMPLGKAGPNGEFVPLTDAERAAASAKPVDYIKTFTEGIRFLEQTGYAMDPESGYESMKHILATLQQSPV